MVKQVPSGVGRHRRRRSDPTRSSTSMSEVWPLALSGIYFSSRCITEQGLCECVRDSELYLPLQLSLVKNSSSSSLLYLCVPPSLHLYHDKPHLVQHVHYCLQFSFSVLTRKHDLGHLAPSTSVFKNVPRTRPGDSAKLCGPAYSDIHPLLHRSNQTQVIEQFSCRGSCPRRGRSCRHRRRRSPRSRRRSRRCYHMNRQHRR